MADPLIESVSDTAYWIARFRALETERPDALFRDPLAARLAGEKGKKIAASMPMSSMTGWTVVIRTCIIDDYIAAAIARGVDTVLNLGAGLDTRPYRMALSPSLRWIEADYPRIIDFKEKQLGSETPRCRLERVSLDLSDLQERRKLFSRIGAEAGHRILVLTEGVVPYLGVEEAATLADDLARMDKVSCWVIDYLSPEVLRHRQRQGIRHKMRNAPFKFTPADWFGFFKERGWHAREIRYLAEEAEKLRRPIPLPLVYRAVLGVWRLLGSRGDPAFRRFAAYVLLERGPGTA